MNLVQLESDVLTDSQVESLVEVISEMPYRQALALKAIIDSLEERVIYKDLQVDETKRELSMLKEVEAYLRTELRKAREVLAKG